jgi:hypothetical protein
MLKYAYNYTYICNCESLIIGKFGSSLYFVKNQPLYEARCSSNNKDHVSQFISSVLPSVTSSNIDKYWSLDLSLSQQIHYSSVQNLTELSESESESESESLYGWQSNIPIYNFLARTARKHRSYLLPLLEILLQRLPSTGWSCCWSSIYHGLVQD